MADVQVDLPDISAEDNASLAQAAADLAKGMTDLAGLVGNGPAAALLALRLFNEVRRRGSDGGGDCCGAGGGRAREETGMTVTDIVIVVVAAVAGVTVGLLVLGVVRTAWVCWPWRIGRGWIGSKGRTGHIGKGGPEGTVLAGIALLLGSGALLVDDARRAQRAMQV